LSKEESIYGVAMKSVVALLLYACAAAMLQIKDKAGSK
jgi:hypothetical protein